MKIKISLSLTLYNTNFKTTAYNKMFNPSPYCYLDLFSVVLSSTPRPRYK